MEDPRIPKNFKPMKTTILLLTCLLILACSSNEQGTVQSETTITDSVPEAMTAISKEEKTIPAQVLEESERVTNSAIPNALNSEFKDALRGIWASKEYEQLLFSLNSITAAENAISFYTDMVFDGDKTLHCGKPSLMEHHYLTLNPDSTVAGYSGEVVFWIANITSETMLIQTWARSYTFNKMLPNANMDKIYEEVLEGRRAIDQKWINEIFGAAYDSLEGQDELNFDGLEKIVPMSYMDEDVLIFEFDQDSSALFTIASYTDSLVTLKGMKNRITRMHLTFINNYFYHF